jgi:hypothetical protein
MFLLSENPENFDTCNINVHMDIFMVVLNGVVSLYLEV